ncbi:MAG: Holliday junction branch migration protein RuvA [Hydrogenibacillus sp.]|nr:Holliday junction branch migration protein RuvA [Hydrogenibacillus sp.]
MFDFLRGRVAYAEDGLVVVDVGGVGYEVRTAEDGRTFAIGADVALYVHFVLREDEAALYGFPEREARNMFRLLLAASGVGPKGALAALKHFAPQRLALAIVQEDIEALTRIPGIGPKTARRLVVELKDRLKKTLSDGALRQAAGGEGRRGREWAPDPVVWEAVEALLALGFSARDAEAAVRAAKAEVEAECRTEGAKAAEADGGAGGDAVMRRTDGRLTTETLVRSALRRLGPTGAAQR